VLDADGEVATSSEDVREKRVFGKSHRVAVAEDHNRQVDDSGVGPQFLIAAYGDIDRDRAIIARWIVERQCLVADCPFARGKISDGERRANQKQDDNSALDVLSLHVVTSHVVSSEATGNEALRAWVAWRPEDLLRGAELDQFTEVHEACKVGDPRGLLQIVRDDDNRVIPLEFMYRILDLRRRDRVDGGARLVKKKDLGA
jgi:hypothetical protein